MALVKKTESPICLYDFYGVYRANVEIAIIGILPWEVNACNVFYNVYPEFRNSQTPELCRSVVDFPMTLGFSKAYFISKEEKVKKILSLMGKNGVKYIKSAGLYDIFEKCYQKNKN